MKLIDQMGALVERLWREKHCDERAFPDVAMRVIAETPELHEISPFDVVAWLLAQHHLPRQLDLKSQFGEPPITVFAGSRFAIDVYFWLDGTTGAHQHGFSGAFYVLSGSSIHTRYRWTLEERLNSRFLLGDLACEHVELLRKGDARPINAGGALIHSLFHLDRPSCTLVLRTYDENIGPQYGYMAPHVAHDPFYRDILLARKREVLAMVRRLDHPEWEIMTDRVLDEPDFPTVFHVLLDTLRHVKSVAALARFLDRARARHPRYVDRVVPVFDEVIRQREIIEKRSRIFDAEHRFFLALLLNVPDRRLIDAMIRGRYPEDTPSEIIERCVAELAAQRIDGGGENPLGVPLDDASLRIFGGLVRGMSDEEICERLLVDYEEPETGGARAAVGELCQAFRSSLLFGRLFT
jgi:hypothetical protein